LTFKNYESWQRISKHQWTGISRIPATSQNLLATKEEAPEAEVEKPVVEKAVMIVVKAPVAAKAVAAEAVASPNL
jgi:hypothetical protein